MALAVSAVVLAAAVSLPGCGSPGGGPRGGLAVHDSSFVGVTFQQGRSSMELSVARGKIVYGRYCAVCHGESGEGDGFNAYNVKSTYGVAPTAFVDSPAFASVPADTVLAAIRDGGPAVGKSRAMPPWGRTLTPGDVIDAEEYVRSLAHHTRE
jgi:cytochrome c oxidase cbb3-type subunit 3